MGKKRVDRYSPYSPAYLQNRGSACAQWLLAAFISTSFLLVVRSWWMITWESGDDFNINHILAGAYGESSPYVLVMQFPLSWILYKLYTVFPTLNLLGLSELFSVWLSFTVFNYLLISKSRRKGFLLSVAFSVLFAPTFYLSLSYTRSATLLAMAGFSLLIAEISSQRLFGQLFGIVLIWVGMMYRWSAGYVAIPYAGLILLFSHFDVLRIKKKRSRAIILCAILALGLAAIAGIDNYAYDKFHSSNDWQSFNSSRASMVDYMPGAYPEDGSMPVSENDYRMIQYSMIFDDYFSAELFENAAETIDYKTQPFDVRFAGFLKKIPNDFIRYVRNGKMVGLYNLFGMMVIAFAIALVFISKKNLLLMLFTVGGTCLLSCYFVWNGRFPPWVQDPLYLCAAFVALYTISFKKAFIRKLTKKKYVRPVFSIAVAVCLLLMVNFSVKAGNERNARNYSDQSLHQLMLTIEADKEHVYLIDSTSNFPFPIMDGYPIWESQQFDSWSNIFRCGTWFWQHPVINNQLDRLGVDSLIRQIPETGIRILTAIDSRTLSWYATFLQEHYDIKVVPQFCFASGNYGIYQLVYQ